MQPGDALADYVIADAGNRQVSVTVYRAHPPARLGLGTESVAVKVVSGGDDNALRRFTRLLKMYARVAHPGLLQVYDAGQHDALFFYTTEWCERGSLDSVTHQGRRGLLTAVGQVAHAAHALHEAGIVHRDIRPGTVLLRSDHTAVLADLGTAHTGTATVTSMAPLASIGYTDPRLLLGEPAGRDTDVYALGATLHHVLTGRHLFPALESGDVLLALRAVLSQPPRIARDALSAEEADLIAACIDRRLEARPPTAELFARLAEELSRQAP